MRTRRTQRSIYYIMPRPRNEEGKSGGLPRGTANILWRGRGGLRESSSEWSALRSLGRHPSWDAGRPIRSSSFGAFRLRMPDTKRRRSVVRPERRCPKAAPTSPRPQNSRRPRRRTCPLPPNKADRKDWRRCQAGQGRDETRTMPSSSPTTSSPRGASRSGRRAIQMSTTTASPTW